MISKDKGSMFTLETFIGGFIVIMTLFFLYSNPIQIPRFEENMISRAAFDCVRTVDREGNLRGMVSPYPKGNLISYWNMNEGSGNNVHDFHGNNDGLRNGPTWTEGKYGKALDFDGNGDYVEVADRNKTLDISDSLTISAWVKKDSGGMAVVNKLGGGAGYRLKTFDDSMQLSIGNGTTLRDYNSNSFSSISGNWSLLSASYEAGNIHFYLNERPVGTVSDAIDLTENDVNLGIGEDKGLGGGWFSGSLDEVRIYDRALSEGEVERLYRHEANVTGLESYLDGCIYPQIGYDVRVCNRYTCNGVSLPENESVTSSTYYVAGEGVDYYPSEITVYGWTE